MRYLVRVLVVPGEDTISEFEITLLAFLFEPSALHERINGGLLIDYDASKRELLSKDLDNITTDILDRSAKRLLLILLGHLEWLSEDFHPRARLMDAIGADNAILLVHVANVIWTMSFNRWKEGFLKELGASQ